MINFKNINKQFGEKTLYKNITFSIDTSSKNALIGVNGCGKSFLFKTIVGEDDFDSGYVEYPKSLSIGYLKQEIDIVSGLSPIEILLERESLFKVHEELNTMLSETDMESAEYSSISNRINDIEKIIESENLYGLRSRAEALLSGLGVADRNFNRDITELSGGYRMRVMLAKELLAEPDFLLLDEPTNYLDVDSIIWLEKFLNNYRGGLLLITHDRGFINRVCNNVVELSSGYVRQHRGNFDAFFSWKSEIQQLEEKKSRNISDKIEKAEKFVERFKAKSTKAAAARSKMKMIEKMKKEMPDGIVEENRKLKFYFHSSEQSSATPLVIENISHSYGEKTVLKDVSFEVKRGEKISVIGPNGSGKSTLLKICAGIIEPSGGNFRYGGEVKVRYFSQHRAEQLEPDKTLFETIASVINYTDRNRILTALGAFMFTEEESGKKVRVLSGGEKSRLSLATILADPGNLIILDEPTNHLDIESVSTLAGAIKNFEGTAIVVSHDEFLLNKISDRIFEIRPGMFRDFPGKLCDYRDYIENGYFSEYGSSETEKGAKKTSNTKSDEKEKRIRSREEKKKLGRQIDKLERKISELEEFIARKNEELLLPEYSSDFDKLKEIQDSLNTAESELAIIIDEWENKSVEFEQL